MGFANNGIKMLSAFEKLIKKERKNTNKFLKHINGFYDKKR